MKNLCKVFNDRIYWIFYKLFRFLFHKATNFNTPTVGDRLFCYFRNSKFNKITSLFEKSAQIPYKESLNHS